MDLKGRKNINKAMFMWAAAALLLLIMATPALSTLFAATGSVNTKAIVNGAVKTKKIANGAVTRAKINRTGLNADLLDGRDGAGYVAKTGAQTMAGKLTAPSFGYSGPKTSYLSIGAVDFNPEQSTNTYDGLASGLLYATAPGGAGAQYFMAPVHLPQGALVKSIRFRFNDSNGSVDFEGRLYRRHWNATVGLMASVFSAGSLNVQSLGDSTINSPEIDNLNYDYKVQVMLDGAASSSIDVRQVMITYETAGP